MRVPLAFGAAQELHVSNPPSHDRARLRRFSIASLPRVPHDNAYFVHASITQSLEASFQAVAGYMATLERR